VHPWCARILLPGRSIGDLIILMFGVRSRFWRRDLASYFRIEPMGCTLVSKASEGVVGVKGSPGVSIFWFCGNELVLDCAKLILLMRKF
jgi:hypothetical protein